MAVRVRVVALAFAAGAVDAIVFLTLFGIFTAHLSGDTTKLAIDLGRGNFHAGALARLLVIVVFVAGVVLGVAALSASALRARGLMLVEIACLVTIMIVGTAARDDRALHFGDTLFYVLVMLAALAMGLQSALIRRTAGTSVHTTFVTGMLTALGEDTVAWFRNRDDTDARRRLGLHSNIWIGYLVGGVAGTALTLEWEFWALALPLVVLAVVFLTALRDEIPA